jgi:hypothetical protein
MAEAIFAETQYAYGLNTCAQALSELEQAEAAAYLTSCITIRLPRSDVPLGRPLRDDEFVAVTWTVAALEDEAIAGKVARRRQRILRLLREAEAQWAVPRDEDLAGVLEVSLSTLRRDMAALREEGHSLPTRGRRMTT